MWREGENKKKTFVGEPQFDGKRAQNFAFFYEIQGL